MPPARKAVAKRIATSLAALAAVAVLAEVGARIWLFHVASEKAFLDYASLNDLRGRKGDEFFVRHRYLGWVPTPRKLSPAVSMIAVPTFSVAWTMTGASTFGSTCCHMTRPSPAPSARAAST